MNAYLKSRSRLHTVLLPVVAVCAVAIVVSAEVTAGKLGIPNPARQTQVRKLLDETLELPKMSTLAKKQQAVQKLLEMAADVNTPGDELYVVLTTALPLARETGDFPIYLKLVDRLVESFQINADEERARQISEFMATCKSATALEPVLTEAIVVVDRAGRENRYRPATELLDAADKHVKRLGAAKLAKMLTEVRQSLRGRELAYQTMKQASKLLEQKPDDPEANTAVGQWLAVYESDWEEARSKLLLGSDTGWKAAASAELTSAAEPEGQLIAADAWWNVAQSATGDAKLAAQRRAFEWYSKFEPSARSPLIKARIAKRLEELSASIDPKLPNLASSTKAPQRISTPDDGAIAIGKKIDLLKAFKLPDHGLRGNIQRNGDSIIAATPRGIFMLPIAARGSFEISIEFTPVESEPFKCMFPVGSTSCSIVVGAYGGQVSGLEVVDGKDIERADVSSGAAVRPGVLAGGRRHHLRIEVNQSGDGASIDAKLDDSRVTAWQGRLAQLSQYPQHVLPCPHMLGIWHFGRVEVHSMEFRLGRGGKAYLLGDDWKNPITQAAIAPPREVASKCVTWRGRNYLFGDKPMTFGEAQRLAVQLQGRLLTISSAEEDNFITENGKAHDYWQSGWRHANSQEWRDDRNRPLRFIGTWAPKQPDLIESDVNLQIWTVASKLPGWHDNTPTVTSHACIEWGDEDSK